MSSGPTMMFIQIRKVPRLCSTVGAPVASLFIPLLFCVGGRIASSACFSPLFLGEVRLCTFEDSSGEIKYSSGEILHI